MNAPPRDPYLALRHPGYRRYLAGHTLSNIGRQALIAAVMWQIYQWTNSATALGLVGLCNVLPLVLLALAGGVLADRLDRRVVIRWAMLVSASLSALLVLVSHYHASIPDHAVLRGGNQLLAAVAGIFERHVDPATLRFDAPALPLIYLIITAQAVVRVLSNPSRAALVPQLLPPAAVTNAITWNSSLFELSTVIGPALGGLAIAYVDYSAVYLLDVLASLGLALVLVRLPVLHPPARRGQPRGVLAGARFIASRQPVLAAMTLDLFAVVLGGVMSLLPIYADRILHVGPAGFGWLRAAPALGAALTAIVSSHLPQYRRPGVVMLWSVAGFGLATCVFAVSTAFWLSLLALFLTGVFDNVSVVIRHTMVQLLTPDELRGRVVAVNQLFVGCSNEISALRGGLLAALLGPVPAAGLGGLGIFAVTALVAWTMPRLRTVAPLHTLTPEEADLPG